MASATRQVEASGNTERVAKVLVSLPDGLLERIDTQARARHQTRSGFLRELAERELATEASRKRSGIQAVLGDSVRLGGDTTTLIRRDRRSR